MDIKNAIISEKENIIKSLQDLIKIKSVSSTPKYNMPNGEGVNNALLYMEELAASMGFKTRNIDGHALEIEYGEGLSKGYIVTHLDVVPEGDGWTYPPYAGTLVGERIYGRGAIDNKGPSISVLYTLKAIKDLNIKLNTRVRIIMGTSEETTMDDLKYYIDKEGLPDWGLSPDNVYPIVNGEYGIAFIKFHKEIEKHLKLSEDIEIVELKGGVAFNSVPEYCFLKIKVSNSKNSYIIDRLNNFTVKGNHKINVTQDGEYITLESFGVAAHGGEPENGVNAIIPIVDFLCSVATGGSKLIDFLVFINNTMGYELNGKKLGIYSEDSSGCTVLNVGACNINSKMAECSVNIRYPVRTKGSYIIEELNRKRIEYGIEFDVIKNSESHYVDENCDFIKRLQKIYVALTKRDAKLLSLKGGTYARMLGDKGVAFGPCELGSELCGNGHRADEYVDINLLITNAIIYGNTILELCNL